MIKILTWVQCICFIVAVSQETSACSSHAAFHAQNREALRALMPKNSVAVFFSYPNKVRSNDVHYVYKANPDLFYLSGYDKQDGILFVFQHDVVFNEEVTDHILLIPPKNELYETWEGRLMTKEEARKDLGIVGITTTDKINSLPVDFSVYDEVFVQYPNLRLESGITKKHSLKSLMKTFKENLEPNFKSVNTSSINKWMSGLKEVKSEIEIEFIQQAINATGKGLVEAMKAVEPNMTEKQAQAIIEYHFKASGSEHPGFPSIVGSGENACILHYVDNSGILDAHEFLLMDVGAEIHGYSADVTRTIPVDGNFSSEEKALYELVLKAQEAGITECVSGNSFRKPHQVAQQIIAKGLVDLGIIQSESEVRNYFMHGTSHYLGLDVHDPGTYGELKPGVILTVEPGIYIKAGSPCDQKWWNMGVRIEDDILVTKNGPRNLSGFIPKQVKEIEEVMAQKSLFNQLLNGNNH